MHPAARSNARPRIFVSYRRQDSEGSLGRLVAELRREFPDNEVFQDWASIAPGEDFVVALERELANCAAALVVIGPRWLSARDAAGQRRLDDPDDWVCREIAECLAREELRVFPVLVDDARMPVAADLPEAIRGLARRQAHPVTNRHWDQDRDELVRILRQLPELQVIQESEAQPSPRGTGNGSDSAPRAVPSTGDGGRKKLAGKHWAWIAGAIAAIATIGLLSADKAPRPPVDPSTFRATPPPPPDRAEPSLPATEGKAGKVFRDCPDCPEMVVVPSGAFQMGSPESEKGRRDDEGPQHTVSIDKPFAVGKYEVSFDEWDACVTAGGCSEKPIDSWGRGRQPVMRVSWNDAQAYLKWLSGKTGQRYRLLSEAEWEYTARAGSTTRYPWGDEPGKNLANFRGSGSQWSGQQTAPVGSFPANAFGLHDMIGNVWEWTQDCWHDSYNGAPTDGKPWEDGACDRRVVRGGLWYVTPVIARSAIRLRIVPGIRYNNVGFRLARTL